MDLLLLVTLFSWAGSFCGKLSSMKAHDLGTICIKEAINRAGVPVDTISEVIYGQVLTK